MSERPWIVTPHEPIVKHEENLWTVASAVPGLPGIGRRMAIVRLSDGRLLFYNAVPLDDSTLAEVQALGKPSLLIIANFAHCIDGAAFRDKLGLSVYGPRRDHKLQGRIRLDGDIADLPKDPAFECRQVAGCKLGEPLMIVSSGPGGARKSLFFADALMNEPDRPGLRGTVFRWMGFTGNDGPRVATPFKMMFVNDRAALRREYQAWMQIPGVVRLIPTHGKIVEGDTVSGLAHAMATI